MSQGSYDPIEVTKIDKDQYITCFVTSRCMILVSTVTVDIITSSLEGTDRLVNLHVFGSG